MQFPQEFNLQQVSLPFLLKIIPNVNAVLLFPQIKENGPFPYLSKMPSNKQGLYL
jgi:hypothetical protein